MNLYRAKSLQAVIAFLTSLTGFAFEKRGAGELLVADAAFPILPKGDAPVLFTRTGAWHTDRADATAHAASGRSLAPATRLVLRGDWNAFDVWRLLSFWEPNGQHTVST